MSVQAVWDTDEKTTIRLDFIGEWTWDEIQRAIENVREMKAAVPNKIDVVVDLTQSAHFMPDSLLTNAKKFARAASSQWNGTLILIGAPLLVEVVGGRLHQIYPAFFKKEILFAASLEEARQMLVKDRK
ncbi:MAG: hypothetical protein K8I82_29210 [Anaerolineae bacterium]|jgi:hypothetical protein|nr:hypothetical protein [Anaerolineae bacterium]